LLSLVRKSYADTRRRELVFEVGDYVYLKVSPMRSVKMFNMKGKLASRYVGPFKVVDAKVDLQTQRANTRFNIKACQLI